MNIIHPGNFQTILSPRCAMDAMKYSRVEINFPKIDKPQEKFVPIGSYIYLPKLLNIPLDENKYLFISKIPHSWFIADNSFKTVIKSLEEGRTNANDLDQQDLSILYQKGLLKVNGNSFEMQELSGRYSVRSDNVALISITDKCNLNCGHCVANANKNELRGEEINLKQLKKLFNFLSHEKNLYDFKIEKKVFISGGEPTKRKDLEEVVLSCNHEGLSTHICTNGLLITNSLLNAIFQEEIAFSVSLDGEKSNHEIVRGSGTFDYTINNIKKIRQKGFDVFINTFLHQGNLEDMKYLLNFGAEIGARGINFIRAIPRGRGREMDFKRVPDKILFRKLFEFMQEDSKFYKMIENENTFSILTTSAIAGIKSLNCGMSRGNYFFMDSIGDIYPCPGTRYPEFKIGNIYAEKLTNLMDQRKNHPLSDLRVDTFPSCSICDFTYFCGGDCRGSAYGNSPIKDIKSPVPYCNERRESLIELFKILSHNPKFLLDKSNWIIKNAREETRRKN